MDRMSLTRPKRDWSVMDDKRQKDKRQKETNPPRDPQEHLGCRRVPAVLCGAHPYAVAPLQGGVPLENEQLAR